MSVRRWLRSFETILNVSFFRRFAQLVCWPLQKFFDFGFFYSKQVIVKQVLTIFSKELYGEKKILQKKDMWDLRRQKILPHHFQTYFQVRYSLCLLLYRTAFEKVPKTTHLNLY